MRKISSTDGAKTSRAPDTVDEYLASVPEEQRAAPEKLRSMIMSVVSEAAEAISYQMPGFRYKGKPLAYLAAFKNHCSFFPASGQVLREYAAELEGYHTSRGTIRFSPDKPIPAAFLKKIVRARGRRPRAP